MVPASAEEGMEVAILLCCCSRECGRGHWGEQCSAEAGARCDQQPQESPGQHYRGEAQCDQRPLEQAAGAFSAHLFLSSL